ncbi:hypothetical protein O4H52_12680 [Sphingomonadaceae bacterium G21617-S1]|nr:hypothetical protein [Sphingomonadaceae bacterium G21617-S1]
MVDKAERGRTLLTTDQAAEYLDIPVHLLNEWADRNWRPDYQISAGVRLYDPEVLDIFYKDLSFDS